jgi:D-isomer specific 2-hydroxyacid dehydrogenase NAD-binding
MSIKMLVFDFRDSEQDFFRSRDLENFDITFYSESLNEETVKQLPQEDLDNATVISVFINSELTDEVINSFKNLRIISTRSTGVDHINKLSVQSKNIAVVNVEGYGSRSVAQYTIGLMIALVRHIIPAARNVMDKKFNCEDFVGRDLSKLTLGVVGTGAIGVGVCKLAQAFNMRILAYDINEKQELINTTNVKYVDFNTLLRESDIVSLHLPFTGDNLNMFSSEQFSIMKNTSYLINTSRGELVNTKELYNAISKGAIKGAALDVVTCEDASFKCTQFAKKMNVSFDCIEEAKIVEELVKLPQVIITPHIAYETQDAIDYILQISFIAILDCIKGGSTYRVY